MAFEGGKQRLVAWVSRCSLLLACAVIAAAPAAAQPGSEPAQAVQPALTPQQMLQEASQYPPGMDEAAAAVRRQLAAAREARDVVKVLCLNDKLTQINLAVRTARDRLANLRAAVAQDDQERASHEFTVLQVLRDRVRTLVTEANQCIGEELGFVGDSAVTMEVDPTIPDDPADFRPPDIISQPPLVASPVL